MMYLRRSTRLRSPRLDLSDALQPFRSPRRVGLFTATQLGVIGLNAATGFFLVRSLSEREFASFTILNAMTATYAVILEPLTGSGLQSVVKGWNEQTGRLGQVMRSAFQARWKWIGLVSLPLLPWTYYLLRSVGSPVGMALLLIGVAVAALPAATGVTVWTLGPRLKADSPSLQKVDALGAASRLCLSVALVSLQKVAVLAVAAAGLAQALQGRLARRLAAFHHPLDGPPDAVTVSQLHALMRAMLVHTVFQCFQAQIGIWVLGLFGTSQSVAQLGALSRLAIVLAPLAALFQQIIIPRFVHLPPGGRRGRLALGSLALLAGGGGLAVLACLLFPAPILWVLGPAYQHLVSELPVAMTLYSVTSAATILWWFNASMGAAALSRWVPPASIGAFALMAYVLRPSDTLGVLWFLLAGGAASLVLGLMQAWLTLVRRSPADMNSSLNP